MSGNFIWKVFLVLLLVGRTHGQGTEGDSQCVSREEFDRVNAKLLEIKDELDVWQETTIDILKRYLLENRELPGASSCNTTAEPGLAGSLSRLQTDVQDIQQQVSTINNNSTARQAYLEQLLEEVAEELLEIKANQYTPAIGTFQNPAISCNNLPAGSQSGYYWIQSSSAQHGATRVYCDLARSCCGSTGGWIKVADIDMTDPTQFCPAGFRMITSPKRSCGRPGSGCVSATFPVHKVQYSKVCGRVIAYQDKSTDAFSPYYHNRAVTIDGTYVEGVSLTHGQNPRKHIWTFAAALDETSSNYNVCPCTKTDSTYTGAVPPFIGQDYFCDTASRSRWQNRFYANDPLWDGAGCGGTSTCCTFNNPPWFCKQLPQPTTDDIELRLCTSQSSRYEDARIEVINMYVQ